MKKDLESIILTRQELQIMKVIWQRGSAAVREVCDSMSSKKVTAYTTVLTLMGILESKGVLVHTKVGRAYIYRPLLSRRQAARNQIHDIVTRFFDGNPKRLIEEILENEVLEREQLGEVRDLLESRNQLGNA
jgi:BlaI family penicillinase repressor